MPGQSLSPIQSSSDVHSDGAIVALMHFVSLYPRIIIGLSSEVSCCPWLYSTPIINESLKIIKEAKSLVQIGLTNSPLRCHSFLVPRHDLICGSNRPPVWDMMFKSSVCDNITLVNPQLSSSVSLPRTGIYLPGSYHIAFPFCWCNDIHQSSLCSENLYSEHLLYVFMILVLLFIHSRYSTLLYECIM